MTPFATRLRQSWQHLGFRKYLHNTSWLMAEQLLRSLAGVLVGIWVARYLGPAQFGIFSYALAFTAIFAGLAKLGLDGLLVRELVNQPAERKRYLGTAFWLKMGGAVLVMLLLLAILPFTNNDRSTQGFILLIATGMLFQSFEVVEFHFQAEVLAKIVSICKFSQLLLSSLLKIYLVLAEADLFWFVLVTAFDALSLALAYALAYRWRNNASFYKHFEWTLAVRLLREAWPLILSAIVITIYMRIDQVMIKSMLGEAEVGIYAAAVRISEAFYFLPTLITASLFPAILHAKNVSAQQYQQRLQKLYTLMVWLALVVAISLSLLADWLVLTLFGTPFAAAAQILVIHAWATIFVFLGVASGKWFIAENLLMLSFWRTLLGVLVNVGLNYLLIPSYGLLGAAWATLVSQASAAYLFDALHPKTKVHFSMKSKSLFFKLR